uniref:Uncharacterized protein n=1 Tax=Opuntia streptacantha TaxID=393608 RepID=A0A7C9A7G7_OPUST
MPPLILQPRPKLICHPSNDFVTWFFPNLVYLVFQPDACLLFPLYLHKSFMLGILCEMCLKTVPPKYLVIIRSISPGCKGLLVVRLYCLRYDADDISMAKLVPSARY